MNLAVCRQEQKTSRHPTNDCGSVPWYYQLTRNWHVGDYRCEVGQHRDGTARQLDVKRPNRRTGFLAAVFCGLRTGSADVINCIAQLRMVSHSETDGQIVAGETAKPGIRYYILL
jgi:hypothetical protein